MVSIRLKQPQQPPRDVIHIVIPTSKIWLIEQGYNSTFWRFGQTELL